MANSCDQVQSIRKGDGVTTNFSFTFEYDKQSEVIVSLWDLTTEYYIPQSTDTWSFANATTVAFKTAPPIVNDAEGVQVANVKIARVTDLDSLIANFYPGSAIRSQDLNSNFEQLQHAIQELRCDIPDDVLVLLGDYWDRGKETITSLIDWESSNARVATTAAIDQQIESTSLTEAPTDGQQYGRQSSSWTVIEASPDSVPEAPDTGIIYGRRNSGWVEVPNSGGGGEGTGQVNTIVAGDDITVDSNDVINPTVSVTPGSFLKSITAGLNITVDGSTVGVTPTSFIPYDISSLIELPDPGPGPGPGPGPEPGTPTVTVTSSSFTAGAAIGQTYYFDQNPCVGDNTSPQLSWSATDLAAGRSVQEWHVNCFDPDAFDFIHWQVFNIPATQVSIAENGTWEAGANVQQNDFGGGRVNGWGGPCPPEQHTYRIIVTAILDDGSTLESAALQFTASP